MAYGYSTRGTSSHAAAAAAAQAAQAPPLPPPPPPPPRSASRPLSYVPGDDDPLRTRGASSASAHGQDMSPTGPAPSPGYNPQAYASAHQQQQQQQQQQQSIQTPTVQYAAYNPLASAQGPRPYNPAAYQHTQTQPGYAHLASPLMPPHSPGPQFSGYQPSQYSPATPTYASSPNPQYAAYSPAAASAASEQAYAPYRAQHASSRPLAQQTPSQLSPATFSHQSQPRSPDPYGHSPSPVFNDVNSPYFANVPSETPYDTQQLHAGYAYSPPPPPPLPNQHQHLQHHNTPLTPAAEHFPLPPPPPPDPSLRRSPTHPQARPLPDRPPPNFHEAISQPRSARDPNEELIAEHLAQQALFDQVESVLHDVPSYQRTSGRGGSESLDYSDLRAYDSSRDYQNESHRGDAADDDAYDSDAEAAAGLEAMRMAEEQDNAHYRSHSSARASASSMQSAPQPGVLPRTTSLNTGLVPPLAQDAASVSPGGVGDDDYTNIDMGMYGGGIDVGLHYGDSPSQLVPADTNDFGRNFPSTSSRDTPGGGGGWDGSTLPSRGTSLTHASSYSRANARVDDLTGGLSEPGARRKMSFDEGDEEAYFDDGGGNASYDESMLDYGDSYGSVRGARPLPAPPSDASGSFYPSDDGSHVGFPAEPRPEAPVSYGEWLSPAAGPTSTTAGAAAAQFPRSASMLSHSSTPTPVAVARRAKTDAEERKRQTMIRASLYGNDAPLEGTLPAQAATELGLDLPTLPAGRRFYPSRLVQRDYERCTEPWALSSLGAWLRRVASGETELREHAVQEALVNLFTTKVSNLNIADAEALGKLAIRAMHDAGVLARDEEWLRFGDGEATGVLFQLTGRGCYSRAVHEHDSPHRCYAHHCQRTVKKLTLVDAEARREDWMTFYRLSRAELEGMDRKAVELQNILHEVVTSEEAYMAELRVLAALYRDGLRTAEPSILPPRRLQSFLDDVFGKLDAVQLANDEFLLPQLRYRQREQGPWVHGYSDIFRSWVRKARAAYVDYAANFPHASFLMKAEQKQNMLFNSFCDGARNNKLSGRLEWYSFLKAPITRLQRYSLLLATALKNMPASSEERRNLETAIDEIRSVTLECDARVAEGERKTSLSDLAAKLKLRPEMKRVELNLTQWGRELFHQGELQRTGTSRFTWLENHVLLFDNYMVLAKRVQQRDAPHLDKYERFDVSKMPIPMDLLVLESCDDDPVVKSSVKGISSTVPSSSASSRQAAAGALASPGAAAVNGAGSSTTMAVTNLEASVGGARQNDEKTLYPFRVRHLGKDVYTLYAATVQNRKTWCDKIVEAKTKHAASLYAQHAEPFCLRVLADYSFAYEGAAGASGSIMIKGTPLSRAVEDVERTYAHTGRQAPICRARCNCATTFTQPHGKQMVVVGTDYGVYATEVGNSRGWSRVGVLEEFNLLLLLSDKSLIAYHLDVVCPASGPSASGASSATTDSLRRSPQKLSGAREVSFFNIGRLKDRTLVFYKKRESLTSVFRVLEPVYQKATERRSRLHIHHRGHTDSFRDYDDFYIPAECSGINIFTSSIAIASAKGFEVLNLDKKQPWSVPDLKQPHVATIASRLAGMETVAMFKLDDSSPLSAAGVGHSRNGSGSSGAPNSGAGEYLCVYEECAVYVNKHGEISRSVVLEFVGRAREACLVGSYLVLFDQDFVEVRNALNGTLKQVVSGRDVRCLDNGRGGIDRGGGGFYADAHGSGLQRSIKFALQHPEHERSQLIVELVLSDDNRLV